MRCCFNILTQLNFSYSSSLTSPNQLFLLLSNEWIIHYWYPTNTKWMHHSLSIYVSWRPIHDSCIHFTFATLHTRIVYCIVNDVFLSCFISLTPAKYLLKWSLELGLLMHVCKLHMGKSPPVTFLYWKHWLVFRSSSLHFNSTYVDIWYSFVVLDFDFS